MFPVLIQAVRSIPARNMAREFWTRENVDQTSYTAKHGPCLFFHNYSRRLWNYTREGDDVRIFL